MSQGRKFGIRLWASTSIPSATGFPGDLKRVTPVVISGYLRDKTGYMSKVLGVNGTETIEPKREAIFSIHGSSHVVSTYQIDDDLMEAEITMMQQRYGVVLGGSEGGSRVVIGGSEVVLSGSKNVRTGSKSGSGTGSRVVLGDPTRVSGHSTAKGSVNFPINPTRTLTDAEAIAAFEMSKTISKNKLYFEVFGGGKGKTRQKALEEALKRAERILNA